MGNRVPEPYQVMIFLYIQNIATSYDAKKMNEVCCVNWPKIQKVTYGSVNDVVYISFSDQKNSYGDYS